MHQFILVRLPPPPPQRTIPPSCAFNAIPHPAPAPTAKLLMGRPLFDQQSRHLRISIRSCAMKRSLVTFKLEHTFSFSVNVRARCDQKSGNLQLSLIGRETRFAAVHVPVFRSVMKQGRLGRLHLLQTLYLGGDVPFDIEHETTDKACRNRKRPRRIPEKSRQKQQKRNAKKRSEAAQANGCNRDQGLIVRVYGEVAPNV
jgi:hypothetical protein